jgi:parallel beta-helix repeat protein
MKKFCSFSSLLHAGNRISGVIALTFLFAMGGQTQVMFTQTLNADFHKGHYNDLMVGSDNVYLPYQASDVSTWLTTTVLPQTLMGHKAATWNNRYVYVAGGYNGLSYSNAVYRATLQSGGISSWTTLNPLPIGIRDAAVVVGTNTIYVMGGRDGSSLYNTIYYAAINTDGSIGAWQSSAVSLPVALWGHTSVYCNGYIYVAGGAHNLTSTTARNNVYYAKVLADNTLSAFSNATNLPATRNGHSMVVHSEKVYVIGGFATGGAKVNTVYNATSGVSGALGSWTTATALPISVSNHSSVVMNGLVTVMAGESGGTLKNTVYYGDITAATLTWTLATNVMYDYTKDGAAFASNGQIGYCGGENLSGTPIHNTRYSNLTLSSNFKKKGLFVSIPFYELGAERLITELIFSVTAPAGTSIGISYRTAGNDGNWSNWTALTATSPITVNQTKRYLQYKVDFTSDATANATFHHLQLYTTGTQLAGNLNAITTFTQAASPYWATSNISFTAGTHTFEAGTVVLFLPGVTMTVGQASIICSGTAADSVKFMGYTSDPGLWGGIYFDPNSDNGVSSQFHYTVIANGGHGSNAANLYCNGSNEPLLNSCSIRNSSANGIRLNGSHINIQNTTIKSNGTNAVYLENSNPTFVASTLTNNGGAGVYFTSNASEPTYSTTTISNNLYGLRYPSPNYTIYPPNGSPTMTGNTHNGICIDGGDVGLPNKVWNSISYEYILLGTVRIGQYFSSARLTIEPGNTVRVLSGLQIQIGFPNYGGELYAIGTADSMITFTSFNGVSGGWEGIYFQDHSDQWGGLSVLDYCVIEKGNAYNYYCVNTVQPDIFNSIIRLAVEDGSRYNNSFGNILNCQFTNNGRYPMYWLNPEALPVHTGNSYSGNGINRIALAGGDYTFDRILTNDNVPYLALNDLMIGKYMNKARLTVDPGVILEFSEGKKLQFGSPNFGGEIYAIGTSGQQITFRPNNGLAGGWEGIYFHDNSDNWGNTSTMQYCIVEKGNEYNIYSGSTSQPTLDNCIIRNSANVGLKQYNANTNITNCSFLNNGSYPIYFTDWSSSTVLNNNTYSGNNPQYIAMSGGDYTESRTVYYDGIPYRVLADMRIGRYFNTAILTVQPGVILAFEPGTRLQLGHPNYGGGIYAEGNAGSLITFTSYNGLTGGWEGLNFHDHSDNWGNTSMLKHCLIEKGNQYNVLAESTNQPLIENTTIKQSAGYGIRLSSASIIIRNTTVSNNGSYGIMLEGSSNPTLGNDALYTCNFYLNSDYEVYNNTANNINARYNYWGTGDSAMIASRIYDKYDNTAKGIVYFGNFAQIPAVPYTNMVLGGTVKYANAGANPMKNAAMVIKDFGGTTVASTTTNTSGVYSFGTIPAGNYQMTITPSNAWGGVNSTDALLILNHFAQIAPLTGMPMAAADVNVSSTVNGTDAMFVMKRYSGMIGSFPSGDYLYHSEELIVNGNQVTNNLRMLCFGDVNATYLPTKSYGSSVYLVHKNTIEIPSFTEFDFPVTIQTGMNAGAISLGFYYPEEFLEIETVEFSGGQTNFFFTAQDGLLRLAWCDLNPMTLQNGSIVVTLKMKSLDLSGMTDPIALELYEFSEFADEYANVAPNVTLEIPEIELLTTGVSSHAQFGGLTVRPNPVRDYAFIEFSMDNESEVSFTLYDMMGSVVKSLGTTSYAQGKHQVELKASDLKQGVYMLKRESINSEQSEMIKVVVSN